jgi:predicted nucleic acid-binding protein
MKDKLFIDSNVFVYAYINDDQQKHLLACNLLKDTVWVNEIILSVQILM